ncbi:hypothetical protein E1757_15795 [Paenibacillus piri]|uniref:Uncharacterized protein n=2 Tax=Paenibacillus piri TaxID=2547395 RepID=A0A4R5KPE0_9BACL|nr:hypothetical protein [Paenibacillus piri]TDF96798.1 hypothetical protein E1757_15795 [Paenibacillus piri]
MMQQPHAAATTNLAQRKLEQILDPAYPLCKDDVVWILEYIKKKVAEEDPQLMELSQPRLMQNFRYFADISLMLIHRRNGFDQEADRLKQWIAEAAYGFHPPIPDKPRDRETR